MGGGSTIARRDNFNNAPKCQLGADVSDGTYFYNRTAYMIPFYEMPSCFQRLDGQFAEAGLTVGDGLDNPVVALGENLCRRIGHLDVLARAIELTLQDGTGAFAQAEHVGALLVSHFGACKSVVDAVAISLNAVHSLELKRGNLDMNKGVFWFHLTERATDRAGLFEAYKPVISEITLWRDEAVHRLPPLVGVEGEGDPNFTPIEEMRVSLCLVRGISNAEMSRLLREGYRPEKFSDPLHFHRRWRPKIVDLCALACEDIATLI